MADGHGENVKQTDFFMLRVSSRKAGDGDVEVRGKVQHVLTGEAHEFSDWEGLRRLLVRMTAPDESDPGERGWGALQD
jgi:hypothetical protein